MTDTNFEVALKAEMRRVQRHYYQFDAETTTRLRAAERRNRRRSTEGEFYYTHPDLPGLAFPTRSAAAREALAS